jgi:hypothetical protein
MAFREGWPRCGEVFQAINKVAHLIDSMALDARSIRALFKIVGTQIVFMTLADGLNFGKSAPGFL